MNPLSSVVSGAVSGAVSGVVLAAGLGTRLQPLTKLRPKPLVPVAGRPLVEFALDALAAAGVGTVGLNSFHLGEQLGPALSHRAEVIRIFPEAALLGTGGGLREIARGLDPGTLIVLNGDALFSFELAPLLARHRASGAEATLVLRAPQPGEEFGRVAIDATGQLQRIAEVEGREPHRPDLRWGVYTGVQIVEPALVAALPPEGAGDVLRTAYALRMRQGGDLRGAFVEDGALWLDVGTPERYREANFAVLAGRLPAPGLALPDADGCRVEPGARIAAGVRLRGPCLVRAGAEIGAGAIVGPDVVVDRGASVAPGAVLTRCVLWPGARAEGTLQDEVLLPS